jgi:hypothetical protein
LEINSGFLKNIFFSNKQTKEKKISGGSFDTRNGSFFDVSKFGENSFVITLVVLSIESLKKQTKF